MHKNVIFNVVLLDLLTSFDVTACEILLQQPRSDLFGCLGGAAVRRRIRDRKVAGSTPGRGVIKSTRPTQPSIHPG